MRMNFGVKNWMYPMPVLMIATYNEDGTANVMNAAWGGILGTDLIAICVDEGHKTTENIKKTGAFTVTELIIFIQSIILSFGTGTEDFTGTTG